MIEARSAAGDDRTTNTGRLMIAGRIPFWKSFISLLLVAYASSALLLVGIFTVLVFENQTDLIVENALYASMSTGAAIHTTLEELARESPGGDWPAYAERIRKADALASRSVVSIRCYDEHGDVLYSEDKGKPTLKDVRDVQASIAKREFESRLFHHRVDVADRTVTLFIPYTSNDNVIRVVQAKLEISQIDARIEYLKRQAIILASAVILIHGAFAVFAFQTSIRPFQILMKSIDRMAEGDYDFPIPQFRSREFTLFSEKIRHMGSAARDMQDAARSANPLTGLPGNVEIQRRIGGRIESGEPFCVLYADLDNFKAYNDSYGFHKGDDVILFTRDVLVRAVAESYAEEAFVGHQGGDDFVVICRRDDWEPIADRCISLFDEGIGDFYTEEDRKKGYIESVGRDGTKARYPIGSLSVATVSNENRKLGNIGEVAKVAAEVKKFVKGMAGSAYAIDRRID